MRLRVTADADLSTYAGRKLDAAKRGATLAARRIAARAKLRLREDVRRAGLGDRVANTWQDKVYPGHLSLRPAGFVWSKAPAIIEGHSGATIRQRAGLWLAIPTEHTPRRGRRKATPVEVEIIFNQDLIVRPGRGRQLLAFVDAVRGKSGKTWRRATNARTGRQSRKAELVLMFVLVPQVTLRKRLNWQRIGEEVGEQWPAVLADDLAREMERA